VGKARVFDTEDDFVKAVENGSIKKGEKTVVILRYLGPKGGPGERLFTLIWTIPICVPVNFIFVRISIHMLGGFFDPRCNAPPHVFLVFHGFDHENT